jgi:sec-independent protein translocase protein TatA
MPNIGPLELIVVLVIVLVIFGPKRLPSLGRQLGTGMREFKDSITGKDEDRDGTARPVLNQAQADEPVATHAAPSAPAEPAASEASPEPRA